MKQVLFALMVLIIAAWTAPVFGQGATGTLLDQVKGKTEADVVAFMQKLSNDEIASLVVQAINAAAVDPDNAAVVAQRDLILKVAAMILAQKPADQYDALVAAIQHGAPGTIITKDDSGVNIRPGSGIAVKLQALRFEKYQRNQEVRESAASEKEEPDFDSEAAFRD